MEITWLGYVLIPIALLFFFIFPKKLYELTVFSIPFTGSALMHISGDAFQGAWISPSMFLGGLLIFRYLISILKTHKIRILSMTKAPLICVALLGVTCIVSLLVPVFINGKIAVKDGYDILFTYATPHPLYFQIQYLTQAVYFVFGCSLAYIFAVKNNTYTKLMRSIQIYVYASFIIAFWGLSEVILFYMDIPYPKFLFSQSSETANYLGTGALYGRPRITSVTLEPSVMSQQLLTAIPLLFFQIKQWKNYADQVNIKIFFFIIIIALAMSTSTTAIVGLACFFFLIGYDRLKTGINIYVFKVLILLFVVAALFIVYILYQKILTTYSGIERGNTILYGLDWFLQYPILGLGWSTLLVFDLLVTIMTGLGLVGLSLFLLLLLFIVLNFRELKLDNRYGSVNKAMQYSFFMALIVSELSRFMFTCQYFWLVLGLTIAASGLSLKTKSAIEIDEKKDLILDK